MKKYTINIAAFTAIALTAMSCTTTVPQESSPYTVTFHNAVDVGFTVEIQPIEREKIATAELWYENQPRFWGKLLEHTGDTARIRFDCYADVFTQNYVEFRLITTTGEIHRFHLEEPRENTETRFTGTTVKM